MISKSNIKLIKSLQQKKFRDELNLFVVEGEKMVQESLQWKSEYLVDLYYTSDSIIRENIIDKEKMNLISEKELKQISSLQTPNKSLAVFKKWPYSDHKFRFYIALDGVQDPGNMGTIMRLADWFGVKKILCSKETVDCFNPKVVQATMGAIFRVDVEYVDLTETFEMLNLPIYGALLEGENIYSKPLTPKGILLLGNEGKGISENLQKSINFPISIPRFGQAESLNVSAAGAILLSEFFRNV
jgi:TrmH family RNA methyltransferase